MHRKKKKSPEKIIMTNVKSLQDSLHAEALLWPSIISLGLTTQALTSFNLIGRTRVQLKIAPPSRTYQELPDENEEEEEEEKKSEEEAELIVDDSDVNVDDKKKKVKEKQSHEKLRRLWQRVCQMERYCVSYLSLVGSVSWCVTCLSLSLPPLPGKVCVRAFGLAALSHCYLTQQSLASLSASVLRLEKYGRQAYLSDDNGGEVLLQEMVDGHEERSVQVANYMCLSVGCLCVVTLLVTKFSSIRSKWL